jgi:hypothetical protein
MQLPSRAFHGHIITYGGKFAMPLLTGTFLAISGKFCRHGRFALNAYPVRIWKKYTQQNQIRQSSHSSIVRFVG